MHGNRPIGAALLLVFLIGPASSVIAGESARLRATRPQILFDTDPGGDDIFALLWLQSLAKQGHADIVAVTTVAGNVDGRHTFANACRTLALGGFSNVEVGRSAETRQGAADAAYIHGDDGMGNLSQTLPPPKRRWTEARLSRDIIIEKLAAAPGTITLVAVGPLTNLAAAEKTRPGILAQAKEVVIMGGAFRHGGNVTPQAEFNIHYDPEAAATVFASCHDIVVLPLDVTTRITFTPRHAEAIRAAGPDSKTARFLVALAGFLTKASLGYRDVEGPIGFHVHDGATLAYLFYPETLSFRRGRARVETRGEWTRGQTVMDWRHGAKGDANAWVATSVDASSLLMVLVEDLKQLCR